MAQERSEAIVLRGVDFSETSRIVTFLTPDRGKLACMANGVRRPKSELAGLLDTFNRLEIVYYWRDSRSVQKLAEGALLDGFAAVKRDLEKSAFAAVPLEAAYKVAHEDEPSHMLYDSIVNGLASLADWSGDARTHAAWQLLGVLRAAGFEPNVYSEGREFSFDTGLTEERGDLRLTIEEARSLQALNSLAPDEEPITPRLFRALTHYTERHLESTLRSARVAEEMTA